VRVPSPVINIIHQVALFVNRFVYLPTASFSSP
jgi:hypothetical protein